MIIVSDIWWWTLLPILPLIIGSYFAFIRFWKLDYAWPMITTMTISVIMFIPLLCVADREINHQLDKEACFHWGQNIDREVAYFDNNYWDYGCYAKSEHGWIERDHIIETEVK